MKLHIIELIFLFFSLACLLYFCYLITEWVYPPEDHYIDYLPRLDVYNDLEPSKKYRVIVTFEEIPQTDDLSVGCIVQPAYHTKISRLLSILNKASSD